MNLGHKLVKTTKAVGQRSVFLCWFWDVIVRSLFIDLGN